MSQAVQQEFDELNDACKPWFPRGVSGIIAAYAVTRPMSGKYIVKISLHELKKDIHHFAVDSDANMAFCANRAHGFVWAIPLVPQPVVKWKTNSHVMVDALAFCRDMDLLAVSGFECERLSQAVVLIRASTGECVRTAQIQETSEPPTDKILHHPQAVFFMPHGARMQVFDKNGCLLGSSHAYGDSYPWFANGSNPNDGVMYYDSDRHCGGWSGARHSSKMISMPKECYFPWFKHGPYIHSFGPFGLFTFDAITMEKLSTEKLDPSQCVEFNFTDDRLFVLSIDYILVFA